MKKIILINTLLFISTLLVAAPPADYKYNPNPQKKVGDGLNKTAAGCVQTTATIDLDINNVRARLMNGGDMWWDRALGTPRYEVPKGSKKNSLFAGSLWLGGYENGSGELKVAAQTFRTGGNDYYSGPLDIANGQSIDFQTCNDWDRFWKLNRADITAFRNITASLIKPLDEGSVEYAAYLVDVKTAIAAAPASLIAKDLKEWPGKATTQATTASGGPLFVYNREMAPFVDLNKDGIYNWRDGDYPDILGDQYIWWIFNDKGDLKTQTQSQSINLEIHTGGFAFATNDCLNESTFFNYKVHNWGSNTLDSCYMATFTDADLGSPYDDFIGCDTAKGLGILYNADAYDEGSTGYGYDLPNVAVDFFRGPRILNDSGKLIELKMSNFTYFTGTGAASNRVSDPQVGQDFYNYMTGSWKDGSRFSEGCNPEGPGTPANSVFIGDPCKEGLPTEVGCGKTPGDRRFVHSAGPFKLLPGAVPSDVTIGAIWTPNVGGGKSSCFTKIILCDLKAQKLFDDKFILPFGPQAPTASYLPLDKKLVFELSNPSSSNNYLEQYGYNLTDPFPSKYRERATKLEACGPDPLTDSLYQFEGYVVYQLKDGTVTPSDIRSKDGSINNEKARIVFQCDKKNNVTSIVNYEKDADISETYFVPKLMIRGENKGIRHNFQLTEDAFASGVNKALINYKTYYYIAIAYAYNKFCDKNFTEQITTQDIQYLESRTDGRELPIKVITAIPHPANDNIYSQNYTEYGTGIQLKRIEGLGNGANAMQFTAETESNILKNGFEPFPVYEPNAGPVDVYVVKPDSLKAGDYEIYIKPLSNDPVYANAREEGRGLKADSANWFIRNVTTGDTIYSEINSIVEFNDQYLRKYNASGKLALDWGINTAVKQVNRPGDNQDFDNNGLISSTVFFSDVNNPWLSGIPDNDDVSYNNWIRSGTKTFEAGDLGPVNGCGMNDYNPSSDIFNHFETIANGTWAPFNLVVSNNENKCGFGLMPNTSDRTTASSANRLQNIHSVDVVFTNDKNLWTKCPVIEMTDKAGSISIAQGNTFKFNIRNHPSWNKQVDGQGNPIYDATEKGMSWFPGYAIDLETGERLNLMFGEESYNAADNATDMLWNPTSVAYDPVSFKLKWGGKHVIYVMSTRYDQGAALKTYLDAANNTSSESDASLRNIYKDAMWVGNTLLSPFSKLLSPAEGLIPNYTKVSIRVARPYDKYVPNPGQTLKNNGWPLYSFSTKGMLPVKLNETGNNYTKNIDSLLLRIQPVPNPYYAYSEYEKDRLDTKVRIINLPEKATIKIFTVDGSLVKTIRKNDKLTAFIDWDLKNEKGILIGSGMYLMHVELDGIGETVLKWFGAMRPVDITQF